jgi:hypothetical protein
MNLTLQQVYDQVNRNPGQRYTSAQIARSLKARVQETTPLLRELKSMGRLKSTVPGKVSLYYTMGPKDIAAAEHVPYMPPFRPLRGYEAGMRRIADGAEAGR